MFKIISHIIILGLNKLFENIYQKLLFLKKTILEVYTCKTLTMIGESSGRLNAVINLTTFLALIIKVE